MILIDGKRAGYSIGVVGVKGDITTLGFVVQETDILHDGGELAVQMGDDEQTRAAISKKLRRSAIKPLDEESARKFNLPARIE